jgi:hypothetical protein
MKYNVDTLWHLVGFSILIILQGTDSQTLNAELAKDNVDKAVGHFDGVDRQFETGDVKWPFFCNVT